MDGGLLPIALNLPSAGDELAAQQIYTTILKVADGLLADGSSLALTERWAFVIDRFLLDIKLWARAIKVERNILDDIRSDSQTNFVVCSILQSCLGSLCELQNAADKKPEAVDKLSVEKLLEDITAYADELKSLVPLFAAFIQDQSRSTPLYQYAALLRSTKENVAAGTSAKATIPVDNAGGPQQLDDGIAENSSVKSAPESRVLSSSKVWRDQHILSLDGGGVKAYASLLILERIMKYVELEEQRRDKETKTEVGRSPVHERSRRDSLEEIAASTPKTGSMKALYDHPMRQDSPSQLTDNGIPQSEISHIDLDSLEPARQPCLYFDYIFGSGTGGLLAVMLGRLRMSIGDALEACEQLIEEVFGSPQWFSFHGIMRYLYDHKKLEMAVKKIIDGAELKQRDYSHHPRPFTGEYQANDEPTLNSEPTECRTVCVAYCFDTERFNTEIMGKLFLFRSYERLNSSEFFKIDDQTGLLTSEPDSGEKVLRAFNNTINSGPTRSVPIWQVVRATLAAPPYFPPMDIGKQKFMDGAVGCNNPALVAFQEVSLMHNDRKSCINMLLSLGTGAKEVQPMDNSRFGLFTQLLKRALGSLVETEDTHATMERLNAYDVQHTGWYHRFNPPAALGALDMDSWLQPQPGQPGTAAQMRELLADYLQLNAIELRRVAIRLVDQRRYRAATLHSNVKVPNSRWRCLVSECDEGQILHNSELKMLRHISQEHPMFIRTTNLQELLDAGRVDL